MLGKRSEAVEGLPQNLLPVAFSGTKPVLLFFLPSSVTCQRRIKQRRISDQAESFPHAAKGRGHILDFKNLAQAINSEKKEKKKASLKKRKSKASLTELGRIRRSVLRRSAAGQPRNVSAASVGAIYRSPPCRRRQEREGKKKMLKAGCRRV